MDRAYGKWCRVETLNAVYHRGLVCSRVDSIKNGKPQTGRTISVTYLRMGEKGPEHRSDVVFVDDVRSVRILED